MGRIATFTGSDGGATQIEYAFLASLIAIAAVLSITAVGTAVSATLSSVATSM